MNILIGIMWISIITLFIVLIFSLIIDYQINKLTKSIYEKYGTDPPDDDFIERFLK